MPQLTVDHLTRLARRLLTAAGTPETISEVVADSLVEANLMGVDSHGVMQLPWYLEEIAKGAIIPSAEPTVERPAPAVGLVRGNKGFGIHALGRATELATEIASGYGSACVGLVECSHAGRIGRVAEAAAEKGMLAIVFGGGGHETWRNVVPFGGRQAIMSTNPYALAVPGGGHGPIVVDFATSTVADGKIAVYRAEGRPVPEGWILDKHGKPTTDPEAFFDGGMHLPAAGHKGYGLGLVAELIGHAALAPRLDFNWLVIAVDLRFFRPAAAYTEAAEAYLGFVKEVPPAEEIEEVLLPGEPERRAAARRGREGVPVPEAVWARLEDAARSLGLDLEDVVSGEP